MLMAAISVSLILTPLWIERRVEGAKGLLLLRTGRIERHAGGVSTDLQVVDYAVLASVERIGR